MRFLTSIFLLILLSSALAIGQTNHIVISEIYGGGGNSGSTWKNDFVELYNPTNLPVNLNGWSVQYGSATGSTWQKTMLSGVIQPKGYFLIQESQGAGGTQALPTPDVAGVILMSATAGKIALVKDTLTNAGPTGPSIVDFVGYGASNMSEGSPATALTNTTSAERKASASSTDVTLGPNGSEQRGGNGWDTNNNANDFVAQSAINPQNSASPQEPPPSIQAGIGTAVISPQLIKADTSMGVTIILRGTSEGVVTGLRFPKHPFFDWSHTTIDLIPTAAGNPILRKTPDSVIVTGLAVSASDSVQVRISGLSAPDTTLKISFRVETGAGSDSMTLVRPLPTFILYGSPRPIADVKVNDAQGVPLNLQQPVTVRGIVTVAQQFGGPAYLQDASGGIAAFDLLFEGAVKIGDEVTITGTVTQFNGLTELSNVTLHGVNSVGNDVTPLVVNCSQIARDGANGNESYEGMLVQLNRVTARDTLGRPMTGWTSTNTSGANFRLFDGTDSIVVRIDGELYPQFTIPAPTGEFDIVGVVGQFVSSLPYVGGYQLMPRSTADIFSKGPVITVAPLESSITPNSFDVKWETSKPGSSFARYGRTKSYELGTIGSAQPDTVHRLTVSGLLPATTYHVLSFSVSDNDTSFAGDRVISTASLGSTGQINVYFNKSINAGLARGDTAKGNANLTNLLIRRINAAQKSVDCALYSMSGSVGQSIASALVQAWARGVKVRFIIERDNLSAGTGILLNQFLTPAGIPWIADDFDAVNAGLGLHHNKFFIFDYRGGSPDQTWVWTGSWNPTDPGTDDDLQNSIEIQDQALASAYTIEFNEMWGSDSTTANRANSRFGARKLDNTPHIFNIDGIPVELYFSPSDRTTSHIVSTLAKAQNSINFALLTLTRSDIAAAMKIKKDAGVRVRGILDNGTDSGSQYSFLTSNGIDVRLDPDPSALFHHKYAVIDAEVNSAQAYVITGSHNWTSAAESSNNENMLILQSNAIANQYLQEFAARYKGSGGKDNIIVGIDQTNGEPPKSFSLSQNYPNPFNGMTNFEYRVSSPGFVTLRVFDILGRVVATLVDENKVVGLYRARWDAATAPSGVYFCELRSGRFVAVEPMVLVK